MRSRSLAPVVGSLALALLVGGAPFERAGSAAPPNDLEAQAVRNLDEGWQLFVKGELVAARERFQAARDALPDKANPYRLLGLVDARLHRCDEAVKSLDKFLARIRPDDPRYAEVVTIRDQCASEVARRASPPMPATARLAVRTAPSGASVRIDGAAAPLATPFEAPLPPGDHRLVIERRGFAPLERRVDLRPGEQQSLDLMLIAAPTVALSNRRWWIVGGVAAGVVAAAALAIGLGVGLSSRASSPFVAATRFPAIGP